MTNRTKRIIASVFVILFATALLGFSIVHAAPTSSIKFCDYSGTRRLFKIIGLFINIAKIVVPLIIIITESIALTKAIMSGEQNDLFDNFKILIRKIVAGLVIFFLPTIIDYTIDSLVGYDDSGFAQCSNCLLDTEHCVIPETDPDIYDE